MYSYNRISLPSNNNSKWLYSQFVSVFSRPSTPYPTNIKTGHVLWWAINSVETLLGLESKPLVSVRYVVSISVTIWQQIIKRYLFLTTRYWPVSRGKSSPKKTIACRIIVYDTPCRSVFIIRLLISPVGYGSLFVDFQFENVLCLSAVTLTF